MLRRFTDMRALGWVLLTTGLLGCDPEPRSGRAPVVATASRSSEVGAAPPVPSARRSAPPQGSIPEIDAGCAPVEQLARVAGEPDHLFALLPDGDAGAVTWRRFTSEADWRRAADLKSAPGRASVWQANGGWMLVSMMITSQSGDWVHFVEYCYRPTGSLAKRIATLNTFQTVDADGGVSRHRTVYVGSDGKTLAKREELRDLQTRRPAPGAQFMQNEEPPYTEVAQLPFYRLLAPASLPRSR